MTEEAAADALAFAMHLRRKRRRMARLLRDQGADATAIAWADVEVNLAEDVVARLTAQLMRERQPSHNS
jgi:hypothetical protein